MRSLWGLRMKAVWCMQLDMVKSRELAERLGMNMARRESWRIQGFCYCRTTFGYGSNIVNLYNTLLKAGAAPSAFPFQVFRTSSNKGACCGVLEQPFASEVQLGCFSFEHWSGEQWPFWALWEAGRPPACVLCCRGGCSLPRGALCPNPAPFCPGKGQPAEAPGALQWLFQMAVTPWHRP